MRLAVLALSATAISGCSWVGNTHQTAYAPGCHPSAASQYGGQFVGHAQTQGYSLGYAQAPGCVGGLYGSQQAPAGYAIQGHGMQAYANQPYPAQGFAPQGYVSQGHPAQAYGAQSYASAGATAGGFSSGGYASANAAASATTLSAAAPYGSAISGQYGQTSQFVGSQGAEVRTVMGAPLYVPQPYPVHNPACCGVVRKAQPVYGGGAMPFGVELFGGVEFEGGGDLFTKKSDGPPDGDFTQNIRVGEIDPIAYGDAFGTAKTIGGALTYDLSPSTTVLGAISHSNAEGQTVEGYTTVQPGTWTGGVFTPEAGSAPRALDGTFTDLETTTLEAGVRHYVGHPAKLRPYIGATGGFTHNGDVQFTQTYSDDGSFYGERRFIESGWSPTASATLGAEMALGPRSAIGIESGLRWRDDMNSTAPSEDRITIPLTLRGRLSF